MAPDPNPATRRIVVKLGTNVIMRPDGRVALGLLCGLVESIAALRQQGHELLVVSSGSIGLGMERLGLTARPTDLAQIQACAATGQSRLMSIYEDAFDRLGCRTAQVLLTEDDFRSPTRHANLARTLEALLALAVIPVINENDTVSVAELDAPAPTQNAALAAPQSGVISTEGDAQQCHSGETPGSEATNTQAPPQNPVISTEGPARQDRSGETRSSEATTTPAPHPASERTTNNEQRTTPLRLFGDNDKLSALVATHVAADLLVLLSDVDGLYDRSPADPAAQLLHHIPVIDDRILALAHGGNGRGRGGMLSKLEAARIAQTAGLTVVIANGRSSQILERVVAGDPHAGTLFPALGQTER